MRKTDLVEAYSKNGEVHLVIKELKSDNELEKSNISNLIKIKAFMKKEAAKPLLLLRAE